MRSPLSRSHTPTAPRRAVGFFRSGCSSGCPSELITQPTSDRQKFNLANPFSRRRKPRQRFARKLSIPFFGANCHAVLDEKQKTQPIESLLFTGIEQRIHPIFPHKRQ